MMTVPSFTPLWLFIFVLAAPHARGDNAEVPRATVDLTTAEGTSIMDAEWRYRDVSLVQARFRAPDAQGQPTGDLQDTWDIEPHAGATAFDDSHWTRVAASELTA